MTTNVGRWETVVSRSKKGSSTFVPKEKKRGAMQALENMPKIDDLVALQPVKESQTMFGAFTNVKENSTKRVKSTPAYGQGDEGGSTKSSPRPGENASSKKKSNNLNKASKPQTLQAAIKLLTQETLEKALSQSKRAFPNSTLLWLKDLASFLNVHFEEVPFEDPIHTNERPEFPSCELPSGLKQVVVRTLQGATNNVLEIFFHHCVQSMVTDLSKGLSIYGYQIVVQLLAYMSPAIVLGDLTKYSELLVENQGRPLRCLTILWAIGQCGHKDLPTALRVFFDIMFPTISSKQLAPFILSHLDLVLKIHSKKLHIGTKSLGLRGYFELLDFFNQSKPTCITTVEMRKLSKSILPKLKAIAYGVGGESLMPPKNLHLFFPSFLSRVDTTGPLKGEFLSSLVECLVHDPKGSFSVWRELYIKHLPQSGTFLKHLVENQGSKATEKINKSQLKETIQSFEITNEELRTAAGASLSSSSRQQQAALLEPAGLTLCEENCRPLLVNTVSAIEASSAVGRGKKWILRLFILFFGFLLVDIFVVSHGVFQDSFAFRVLLAAGLSTNHLDQIVVKIEMLLEHSHAITRQVRHWFVEDLPLLYADIVDRIEPNTLVLREKALELFALAWVMVAALVDAVSELWASFVEKVVESVEWWTSFMEGGGLGAKVGEIFTSAYDSSLTHLKWASTVALTHLTELWEILVTRGLEVKEALESNETALGIWRGAVEAWELIANVVTNYATMSYAWLRQSLADLETMVK